MLYHVQFQLKARKYRCLLDVKLSVEHSSPGREGVQRNVQDSAPDDAPWAVPLASELPGL